jgi:UDP-N-acetylmuramoylalanine--D-glutamate ligase
MTGTQSTLAGAMAQQHGQFDTVVIGLGKTGMSCVRFLYRQGIIPAVVDSRHNPPELENLRRDYADVPVFCGPFDYAVFSSARLLVISPGVSQNDPVIRQAVKQGAELVGDIELFARHAQAPIVAVTGSNGKSTVSSLISHMIDQAGFRSALGGNIGVPALSFLETDIPDFYVLELSSFQLETVKSLNAAVSVVLNISEDHMDRYDGIEAYAKAKETIYEGTGTLVINDADERVVAMMRPDRKVIHYSLAEPQADGFGLRNLNNTEWLCLGKSFLLPTTELRLQGRHNLSNALAAFALGYAIGLPLDSMVSSLKNFAGLPHRCEWVRGINGIDWINDSKGTNPGATIAAIEGLSTGNDIVLIAGGDGKGADFSRLAEIVPGRVHTTVLIGRDANKIAASLEGLTRLCYATSMDNAVKVAASLARSGDKVLMSPACASFDMFRDYQHRGEQFRLAVEGLDKDEVPDA